MADDTPARFRKTKTGKWAVMAPIEALEKALAEGGKVDVQRKSGDWSTFAIVSLGRPFDVDGVQMCYGYGPDEEGDDGPRAGGAATSSSSSGDQRNAPPPPGPTPAGPPNDPSEPLPEYQGGPEDEWDGF